MFSYLRLAALFGALVGIFGLLGFLFGGFIGLTFALILAIAMNFLSFYYSDSFVVKMYGAQEVSKEELPDIHSIVKKQSEKAGIPKPKVYMMETQNPNAFATGRNPESSLVCITTGLVDKLNKEEIEGVISHELSHIKNRDTLISTIAGTLAGAISIIGEILWFSSLGGDDRNPLALIIGIFLAPLGATLIRLAISRSRENIADSTAAEITSPLNLASALKKISEHSKKNPIRRGSRATSHLFIINPFKGSFLTKLFSTHPPLEERISNLESMA